MHQQYKEYCMLSHLALAGAVWGEELKKVASYKELINHWNNKVIRERWMKGRGNKFGQLFQGLSPNVINGLDVLQWIKKHQVPADKTVTYRQYTAALWPEKIDGPHCVCITVGSNLLEYAGDVTTHTASIENIKAHWNSVVSTQDARYYTGDLSNMYLMSDLVESKYKFNYTF